MSTITLEGLLRQASPNESAGEDSAARVVKKKRNLPGKPDPDAEVVALSPGTLMATNRYMCEVCLKGFQRDQNLQLHRRGHNLPWKLKQRSGAAVKRRVYICPEVRCPHHDPSRALGDLTGIKKHYCRKHGEKKWKCDKCSKPYAVQSDWKAHAKICGTREYRCDCGTIFLRRDSFITHRAFCDALAEENYKVQQGLPSYRGMIHTSTASSNTSTVMNLSVSSEDMRTHLRSSFTSPAGVIFSGRLDLPLDSVVSQTSSLHYSGTDSSTYVSLSGSKNTHWAMGSAYMSATALLQKATEMGAMVSDNSISPVLLKGFAGYSSSARSCGSVQEKSSQSSGVLQNGLLDAHMLLQSEHRHEENPMRGGFMDELQKGYGSERTTADFLSLGPVDLINTGETIPRDSTNRLGYAAEQQNLHNMSSYCGSPLEKSRSQPF
ncbi:zinc finger protein GAI-ASSOCIATED FACTOR 1-like [Aristolochia californica]|uniref:zinc finger protein GAI-ASSOCIATED FACTOR 1-like n=1 Tax=Aristolochia californica TaxID=171875 RepID=UPI0035D9A157